MATQTLYELRSDWARLMDYIEDDDMDQEILLDTWLELDEELEEKADCYTIIMKRIEAEIDMFKAEEKRLADRRRTMENKIGRLGDALKAMMIQTGKTKFKTEKFSYGIQKNPPKVVIDNESLVPIDYMIPQDPKVDTKAIKEYLKENECEFAHLEQGESLRIR